MTLGTIFYFTNLDLILEFLNFFLVNVNSDDLISNKIRLITLVNQQIFLMDLGYCSEYRNNFLFHESRLDFQHQVEKGQSKPFLASISIFHPKKLTVLN